MPSIDYGPWVRIILRYLIGGCFVGSAAVGQQLAADPDLVAAGSVATAAAVEGFYALAKQRGWKL